MTNSKDVVLG